MAHQFKTFMLCLLNTELHLVHFRVYCGTATACCSFVCPWDCCSQPCLCALAPLGEQDDKGVQVEAQDLGYETSGRSETEVEGSSTGRQGENTLFYQDCMSGFLHGKAVSDSLISTDDRWFKNCD